jgi:hypothetical protein
LSLISVPDGANGQLHGLTDLTAGKEPWYTFTKRMDDFKKLSGLHAKKKEISFLFRVSDIKVTKIAANVNTRHLLDKAVIIN